MYCKRSKLHISVLTVCLVVLLGTIELSGQKNRKNFPVLVDSTNDSNAKRMLSSVSDKNVLILPILSYNLYDGVMIGGVISNYLDSPEGFSYIVAPQFGIASTRIVGSAGLAYNILNDKNSFFDRVRLGLDFRTYSFEESDLHDTKDQFYKVAPEIAFYKDVQKEDGLVEHRISYRFVSINQHYTNSKSMTVFLREDNHYYVNELRYEHNKDHDFSSSRTVLFFHQGNNAMKLFGMREQAYAYFDKFKVKIKLTGTYLPKNQAEFGDARISIAPNGTTSFSILQRDYTHDHNLIGRSARSGIWSQQIYSKDAGLRTNVEIFDDFGKWMIGVSGDIDFPIDLPIRFNLYFDAAIYKSGIEDPGNSTTAQWVGGLGIPLLGDNLAIYIPIISSSRINNRHEFAGDSFFNKIAFTLKLKNPERVVDRHFN